MAIAYLNIGSNIGDREAQIECAVAVVERLFGSACRRSGVVDSEAWGFESENRFLNIGLAVFTELEPEAVLKLLQRAEAVCGASAHRDASGGYVDRNVDIDFIALDDVVWNSATLTLPHPLMHARRFVLEPMAELASEWRHPLSGLTAAQMLENCR